MPPHFADSDKLEAVYKMLSVTEPPPAPEVIAKQYRPASVVDKAHINGRYVGDASAFFHSFRKLTFKHFYYKLTVLRKILSLVQRCFELLQTFVFLPHQMVGLIALSHAAGHQGK